ncbi:2-oxo-4-hydroxy-4-carboxy-5-ureidoimidazoline decarboxylase [Acetobacteraceae bacterium KSS8]|uniref:2-oxo-4-hydroxy-4-carboxy-5-ureidoimidazoline decarboxylase n=1 Tax=Endosaccharibacter trunci TaxID=2812733 RepID=A0ABT1W916_9PROT|nr:2-oxo-4-hydroxy-4-carboxy-5-ureidoimidazoline decarboxylase [Acetobacteraceae bacterium KSS8]
MVADPLLQTLNDAALDDFVAIAGPLYEHSPWIAAEAWRHRPFADRAALHAVMQGAVTEAPEAAQLALIRAHPDLAGKLARAGTLEAFSTGEQKGLGLDRLPDDLFERFDRLNTAYRERFGFPFVIAVRAQTRDSVLEAFERRLQNDAETERHTAIAEIGRIAWFRLQDLRGPL